MCYYYMIFESIFLLFFYVRVRGIRVWDINNIVDILSLWTSTSRLIRGRPYQQSQQDKHNH